MTKKIRCENTKDEERRQLVANCDDKKTEERRLLHQVYYNIDSR